MVIDRLCVLRFLFCVSVFVVGLMVCRVFGVILDRVVCLRKFIMDRLELNCVECVVGKMWFGLLI